MSFRRELNSFAGLEKDIYAIVEEIKHLRIMAENLQSICIDDKLQSSPHHDRMPGIVVKIVEYQEKLERKVAGYSTTLKNIENKIEAVKNSDERLILHLRYVQHKKWKEIAEIVCLSERQVFYIHRKAILHV